MEEVLKQLREAGWRVAVHNDYKLGGVDHTFWLFTHPCGLWLKGEGFTDLDALQQIWDVVFLTSAEQAAKST